ncbi:hypothetical protein [Rhizobium sp. BK112]|nr:hypothetical protein [Rhizobium sp. BK112]MBB4177651.1 hypothetical protein [Rhizobium sp. BK109]
MGREYKQRRDEATADAAKYLANHVMIEEPVKSFRFHMHYIDKKVTKRQEGSYPFLRILPPVEAAKFAYNSTYAYTLTWTPGHMTIVGDLGQLTVVHYHAMQTLEEACRWLQSCDFDYLLSKTNEQQEYDRDATLDHFKRELNEGVIDHLLGTPGWGKDKRRDNGDIQELRAWIKQRPLEGQLNEEGEDEQAWLENRPLTAFDDKDRDCWDRWKQVTEFVSVYQEQYDYTKASDRRAILDEVEHHFETEHDAAEFLWRDLSDSEPCICREYRHQAFFQIAAIQHGTRMILGRHFSGSKVAA